ncbi:MAG: YtpR family tRNA-binding protein [Mycoplasma sp.]
MNIFFINSLNGSALIGVVTSTEPTKEMPLDNGVAFFSIEKNELLGFNILNFKMDSNIFGRVFPNDKIRSTLNKALGLELASIDNYFKVGNVLSCEKIEGTHLSVCKVDIATEVLDIICGAPNVKQGLKVVVAKVGAYMPSGLVIKHSKIRGFDSNGMLCSQKELGVTGFNDSGIIELDAKFNIGEDFTQIYKIN